MQNIEQIPNQIDPNNLQSEIREDNRYYIQDKSRLLNDYQGPPLDYRSDEAEKNMEYQFPVQ